MDNEKLENKFLCFNLGLYNFAVPILLVKEITTKKEIVRIPSSTNCFLGVTSFRGQLIPIFDLWVKLSIRRTNMPQDAIILILEMESGLVGIPLSSLSWPVKFELTNIFELSYFGSCFKSLPFYGIAIQDNYTTLLLNLNRIFYKDEVVITCNSI